MNIYNNMINWLNCSSNKLNSFEVMIKILRKSRFSSSILNMLKSSVGYEHLQGNSPLHDKQTLKISWKSTG